MDFFIIANAWSAGKDNPTSKHRIALELIRRGHRILWIEGSGMRTPSMGSSHDRLRMLRKVGAAFRGVRVEEIRIQNPESRPPYSAEPMQNHGSEAAIQNGVGGRDYGYRLRGTGKGEGASPLIVTDSR